MVQCQALYLVEYLAYLKGPLLTYLPDIITGASDASVFTKYHASEGLIWREAAQWLTIREERLVDFSPRTAVIIMMGTDLLTPFNTRGQVSWEGIRDAVLNHAIDSLTVLERVGVPTIVVWVGSSATWRIISDDGAVCDLWANQLAHQLARCGVPLYLPPETDFDAWPRDGDRQFTHEAEPHFRRWLCEEVYCRAGLLELRQPDH